MTKELWTAVDQYICGQLVPSDPVLDHVVEASTAAGLPPIAVTPNLGKLLYLLARREGQAESSKSAPWPVTARSGWPALSPPAAA